MAHEFLAKEAHVVFDKEHTEVIVFFLKLLLLTGVIAKLATNVNVRYYQ